MKNVNYLHFMLIIIRILERSSDLSAHESLVREGGGLMSLSYLKSSPNTWLCSQF